MVDNSVEAREAIMGCVAVLEDLAANVSDPRLSTVIVSLRSCAEWLSIETP